MLHGGFGLGLAYVSVQGPMLVAMIRARTGLLQMLHSPMISAPLTIVTGLSLALFGPALQGAGAPVQPLRSWEHLLFRRVCTHPPARVAASGWRTLPA